MELSELGILFATEGADAAISKMEDFKAASVAVIQTDDERVKAAGRVATATAALSDQINRSILGYAGSKSLVYEYTAAQLGVNDALQSQIEYLQRLERYAQTEKDARKADAAAIRENEKAIKDFAREVDLFNKQQARNAAEAEAARKKELASRQAYYDKIIADAKAAEQATTDARHKAILDAQNATARAAAMYIKDEQERVKATQKAEAEIASANKKAADNAQREAERKALSEIAWAKKSRDEQIRIKDEIATHKAAGISAGTISEMFGPAAIDGVVKQVDNLADRWHHVTLNTSRARSEMVVLAHEAVQGRFSRIPASLMVFAEYTDLTALALSGMGLAIMGVVAAMVLLSIAMVKGMLEQRDMQNALINTGNYAGMTADGLEDAAHAAVKLGGSIGSAKALVIDLASSGKYTADQIGTISKAVIHMEHATGDGEESIKALTQAFASLQVEANAHSRYSDEVTKAALKLNTQYNFLTVATLAQVRALEDEGKSKQASILLTNEFAQIVDNRAKEISANLGLIQIGWRKIKETIGETVDAAMSWGKTESALSRVKELTKELERYKTGNWFGASDGQIARVTAELNQAQKELIRNNDRAAEAGAKAQAESRAVNALSQIEIERTHLKADKMSQLELATEAYSNRLEAIRNAGYTQDDLVQLRPETIVAHLKALEEKYREKNKVIKENSEIALNQQLKSQNLEFQMAEKQASKLIQLSKDSYGTVVKQREDDFAILRKNAQRENEIGFANASQYVAHADMIKKAASDSAAEQIAALQAQEEAGRVTTANIIKTQEGFTTRTAEGAARRTAVIQNAVDAQVALHKKLADQIEVIRARADNVGAKADSEAYKALDADMNKVIQTLENKLAKEEKQLRNLQLTKEESAKLAALEEEAAGLKLQDTLKQAEADAIAAQGDAEKLKFYEKQIAQIKQIIILRDKSKATQEGIAEGEAAKLAAEEWEKGWKATNKYAEDAFENWAVKGVNAVEEIGKALKKALLSAIYEASIKPIVFQLYASVMGGAPGGAAGSAVGGMAGSVGSGLGNALGLAGMGAAFNGAATAGYALAAGGNAMATMGAGASMLGSATGLTSAAAGVGQIVGAAAQGVSTALAAIPGWGWAAMAVLAIANMKGEYVQSLGESVATVNRDNSTSLGGSGGNNDVSIGGGLNIRQTEQSDNFVSGLASAFVAAATKLGISTEGVSFGAGFNNSDGGKFAIEATVGGAKYDPGQIKTTEANLSLEASRAVFFALQSSELPEYLSQVFDGITASTATTEQIENALAYAQSLKDIRTGLLETRTPMQAVQEELTSALLDLGTNAQSFKTDFVAAIDAGIGPDALAKWQLAGAGMAAVAAEAEKLADVNADLQDKLDLLTGAQTERSLELRDATDDSTKALIRQIHAQEDLNEVAEAAADAAKKWADEIEALNKIARDTEEARVKKAKEDLDKSTSTVEELRNQATQNYLNAQERVTAAQQKLADVLRSAVGSFQDVLDGLDGGRTAPESKANALRTVQELEARIRGGDTSAWGKMPAAIKAFVELSDQTSSTLIEYRRDEAYAKALLKEGIAAGNAQIKLLPVEMQKATDPIKDAYDDLAKATREEEAARVLAIAMQASLTTAEKSLGEKYLDAIEGMPDAKGLEKFYKDTLKAAEDAAKVAAAAAEAAALILAGMNKTPTGGGPSNIPGNPNFVGPVLPPTPPSTGPQPDGLVAGSGALDLTGAGSTPTFTNGALTGGTITPGNSIKAGYDSYMSTIAYTGEGAGGNSADIFNSGFVRIYTSQGAQYGTTELYARMLDSIAKSDGKDAAAAAAASYGVSGPGLDILRKALPGASFEIGSNFIEKDMAAFVHQGEEITPRPFVDMQRQAREETNLLLSRLVDENKGLRVDIGRLQTRLDEIVTHTETTADALEGATKSDRPIMTKEVPA